MVLANWRFVLLLVIFSGFWGMINVLFGFLPLYVETFTDLYAAEAAIDRIVPLTRVAGHWLNPEVLISLDALLIVLFQATISYLTRRWPTLRAMLVGTTIATVSWVFPALSPVATFISLGIVVWSIGEMICSARFFEYCGTIAPKDQVALYLGYSFFAIFIGNFYSGPWAGWLYETIHPSTARGRSGHPTVGLLRRGHGDGRVFGRRDSRSTAGSSILTARGGPRATRRDRGSPHPVHRPELSQPARDGGALSHRLHRLRAAARPRVSGLSRSGVARPRRHRHVPHRHPRRRRRLPPRRERPQRRCNP